METYKTRGVMVYSNDKLQSNLRNIVESNMPQDIKDLFIKLISDKQLVAVITSKNLLQKLLNKIKRHRLTNILGTCTKERMFIFLEDDSYKKGIVETIIHESMHFAALKNYPLFFKENLNIFYNFYSYFYKEYLICKEYDKDFFNKFIINLGIQDRTTTLTPINYQSIEKGFEKYTSLEREEFEKKIKKLLQYMNETFDGERPNARYPEIVSLIRKTYTYLFKGFDDRTYVGQEMYYPSEIISVLSTININHPNIKKTLDILKK